MDLDNSIYDYDFVPGDRAQYVYIDSEGEEKTLTVRVLDGREYPHGKLYVIGAHEGSLKAAGIEHDDSLSNHYFAELPREHKAALLDPDELDPHFVQFKIIVDNTRGHNND